jgi:Polyketide cyclase / dehydrase and lipid transport
MRASRALPVGPAETYAFLSEPSNHRRLTTSRIRLLELHETADGQLSGGLMLIRGPLGLRRLATTRLESVREPGHLAGTVRAGAGTELGVRWDLHPAAGGGTVAVLSASVGRLAPTDRLLLTAGGRRWIRRLFSATLDRLAAELGPREEFRLGGVLTVRASDLRG